MAIEQGMFQNLQPSRYVSFHYPNPRKFNNVGRNCHDNNDNGVEDEFLRVAVLDSPQIYQNSPVRTAAMLVPKGREDDCLFSSESGHCQLLTYAQVSRLVLISRTPSDKQGLYAVQKHREQEQNDTQLKQSLTPLLLALCPRVAFQGGIPSIPFVSYTDNVINRVILEKVSSPLVGMMLVEDVQLLLDQTEELSQAKRKVTEWRRRLRFERMPDLIQTEVALVLKKSSKYNGKTSMKRKAKLALDLNRLVHQYLPPIVAGLVLVAPTIEKWLKLGDRPNLLCIGVGGGALMMFLKRHFKFSIVGVEMDEVVLKLAKKFFGLVEDEHLQIKLGDGVETVENIAQRAVCSHFVPTELAGAWQDVLSSAPNPKEFHVDDSPHEDVERLGPLNHLDQGVEGTGFLNPKKYELAHGLDQGVKVFSSSKLKEFGRDSGINEGTEGRSSLKHPKHSLDQEEGLSSLNPQKIKLDYHLDEVANRPDSLNCYIHLTNPEEFSEASDLGSSISGEGFPSDLDSSVQNESFTGKRKKGLANVAKMDPRVHVIVIDVDAADAQMGLSAPPLQFIGKKFLLAARIALHDHGILAMNVVPSSKHFYNDLVSAFREVFLELYEIEVNNGENYVLFASPLCIASDGRDNAFAHKVKHIVTGGYTEQIRKL
eukprot:Gb_39248 [translate_table: standard]